MDTLLYFWMFYERLLLFKCCDMTRYNSSVCWAILTRQGKQKALIYLSKKIHPPTHQFDFDLEIAWVFLYFIFCTKRINHNSRHHNTSKTVFIVKRIHAVTIRITNHSTAVFELCYLDDNFVARNTNKAFRETITFLNRFSSPYTTESLRQLVDPRTSWFVKIKCTILEEYPMLIIIFPVKKFFAKLKLHWLA